MQSQSGPASVATKADEPRALRSPAGLHHVAALPAEPTLREELRLSGRRRREPSRWSAERRQSIAGVRRERLRRRQLRRLIRLLRDERNRLLNLLKLLRDDMKKLLNLLVLHVTGLQ